MNGGRLAGAKGSGTRAGTCRLIQRVGVFALVACAVTLNSCSKSPTDSVNISATPAVTNSTNSAIAAGSSNISESVLNGHWLRPDGGYVIEVRSAAADGKIEAYYFNPQPINVSRAEWRREKESLHVFVELRDRNYPGATYKLRYLPEKDQLAGDYFQPLHQQTFAVQFIRQPR